MRNCRRNTKSKERRNAIIHILTIIARASTIALYIAIFVAIAFMYVKSIRLIPTPYRFFMILFINAGSIALCYYNDRAIKAEHKLRRIMVQRAANRRTA